MYVHGATTVQQALCHGVRRLGRSLFGEAPTSPLSPPAEPAAFVGREALAAAGLGAAEAAERLGVPVARVQKWLAAGELAGAKASGRWRVPAAAVAELAGSGRMRGRSGRLDPRFRG